jgi:hypothetical protein
LRCLNCIAQTVSFIASEAIESGGSFKDLVPEILVEYLLP